MNQQSQQDPNEEGSGGQAASTLSPSAQSFSARALSTPPETTKPVWQRLGEVELIVVDDATEREIMRESVRMNVRQVLAQSVAGYVALDAMQAPLESAILDAMDRKSFGKAGSVEQRLIISCLNPPEPGQANGSTGWSFFVIERPAAGVGGAAVEVIELCLYHE